MDRKDLEHQLKHVQKQINTLLQSVSNPSLSHEELLAIATADMRKALAELQAIAGLRQFDEEPVLDHPGRTRHQQDQELFDCAPGGYIVTNALGVIQQANLAAATLLNVQQRLLIGNSLAAFVADEAVSSFLDMLSQLQQTEGTANLEVQLKSNRSDPHYAALSVNAIHEQEQRVGFRWLLSDLTERKQVEKIWQQQSKLYQQMQQLNTDLEQQVQRRTDEVQKALNFESMLKRITDKVRDSLDESQILHSVVQELTLVLELGGCNAALYDLDQGTSTICYEYIDSIPTSQGRVAQMGHFPEIYRQLKQGYFFQFCSLIPNPARGQVAMLACPIFVDSTSAQGMDQAVLGDLWLIHHRDYVFNEFEIRLVQQVANQCAIAIRQARLYQAAQGQVQELEKLNRLKDEFLSTVSHELRTPISNVKMAIQMLRLTSQEEKRQKYLEILDQESTREAELINDLLDLQRLEAAPSLVELQPIQLQKWLPDLVEPFQSRLLNQQQTFQIECPADLPPLISDITILRRILGELINNACKYTIPGGEIILSVYFDLRIHSPGSISGFTKVTLLTLRNQAEIAQEELPKIFEKFYRCLNTDPWSRSGTGLGLALVQKLVEQLNGTIHAESKDRWTTFTVELPALSTSAS